MHPQTFGIGGFNAGDIVAAVNPETLIELSTAVITDVKELSPREILLSLDEIDENFIEGMMIENISANSEVIIKNNFFSRIPTRGILVSTRGKVLIEDNTFDHIMGNGVLIADDARSWYESGPVKDVTIRNNVYRSSKGNFVVIKPECVSESELAVHTGISITDNRIELKADKLPLIANNTDRLLFSDNIVYGRGAANSPKLEKVYNSIINTGRE